MLAPVDEDGGYDFASPCDLLSAKDCDITDSVDCHMCGTAKLVYNCVVFA